MADWTNEAFERSAALRALGYDAEADAADEATYALIVAHEDFVDGEIHRAQMEGRVVRVVVTK